MAKCILRTKNIITQQPRKILLSFFHNFYITRYSTQQSIETFKNVRYALEFESFCSSISFRISLKTKTKKHASSLFNWMLLLQFSETLQKVRFSYELSKNVREIIESQAKNMSFTCLKGKN